ncbi:MAG TPA: hypothetical protein VHX90_08250 [Verrucomicrobiae bacterium]|nr:hypothetical protein [Verrucomicrobiae bacterium]
MHKTFWTILAFWLCGLLVAARADTFQLTDGSSLTGDIVTFNDNGITFRMADDSYTNVMWTKFSQDALKQLEKRPKIKPLVEAFIEIPASERPHKPEPRIRDVKRLELPPNQSIIGALFSSSVGLFVLFVIYAANLYAGFEIAAVRAQPIALVMGVTAVLPILGPIIFLSLPMRVTAAPVTAEAPADAQTFIVPGQPDPAVAAPGGIHLAESSWQKAGHPEPQIFQRGQFTFNRRFLETKFSNFFGMTRREADRDMVLIVKAASGTFVVQRISRIAANDAHFEVVQGAARREIMIPFADIQEIQLKHKDA